MKPDHENRYEDIISLPHHVSATRPGMQISNRAAQFSPFAALTGYEAAIKETGRLTDVCIELDENKKNLLDEKLQMLAAHIGEHPEVSVTYFVPDTRKSGGAYVSVSGRVKKLDEYKKVLIMTDGTQIPLEQIYDLCAFRR